MDPNVALPFASSVLSFAFFVFLIDQWRERRRPYQLIWAVGMLWYAISAGTEFLGGAFGWTSAIPRYRNGATPLFAGFLVSIEVFREIRIPFTRHVVRARQVEA